MSNQYYIGLMSGTSMDGVDAVLATLDGTSWHGVQHHVFLPYTNTLKHALLALQNSGTDELSRAALLAQELAALNAKAVMQVLAQAQINANDVAAIGCHGQTIRHAPQQGYSIQLMDYARLAELTKTTVIGDFRSRDLAAGGQGAPLVPAFHHAVFSDTQQARVVLNLGGIANISVLPADDLPFGFDTGPANMLMDAWVQSHWQQDYDAGGHLAASGKVLPDLLRTLLLHPYFRQPYPKSTGRDLFSLNWLYGYLNGDESAPDVLRTLLEFTVQSICDAIIQVNQTENIGVIQSVYACGGGVCNQLLMMRLREALAQQQIMLHTTDALNLPAQQTEAAAFAWLAACWVNRCPVSVHRATGACGARILGCAYLV
ncbi:anhydro-N-acetylmuramic acid kinase [Stenoxybacter acetivorans]|uniref:anhydro-N-acetylmuramic acid kinase n=1 Tax=Stenoxybacter acetivorans TaxID=422441 RepID=UPI00056A2E48|nr:anhydro-N-acetylmuramic acid kinase [Stenoxybacter acetivorans]